MDSFYSRGGMIWCVTKEGRLYEAYRDGPGESNYSPWVDITPVRQEARELSQNPHKH
jgi:hypothetical protein